MKRFLSSLILLSITTTHVTIAQEAITCEPEINPPKWEEYIPKKYQNPRDFSRGKSIGELATGIFLTDLLITAPIGIPMIVHSTTKLKNKSYYDKKIKFEEGLKEAEKITDIEERQKAYENLLKECKMTEKMKEEQLKKQKKKAKPIKELEQVSDDTNS